MSSSFNEHFSDFSSPRASKRDSSSQVISDDDQDEPPEVESSPVFKVKRNSKPLLPNDSTLAISAFEDDSQSFSKAKRPRLARQSLDSKFGISRLGGRGDPESYPATQFIAECSPEKEDLETPKEECKNKFKVTDLAKRLIQQKSESQNSLIESVPSSVESKKELDAIAAEEPISSLQNSSKKRKKKTDLTLKLHKICQQKQSDFTLDIFTKENVKKSWKAKVESVRDEIFWKRIFCSNDSHAKIEVIYKSQECRHHLRT